MMHHRNRPSSWLLGTALIAFGAIMIAYAISIMPPPVTPQPACHVQTLIELTGSSGLNEVFTVANIAAVIPNPGTYEAPVHAVVSTLDNHQYGVRESVSEIADEMHAARCQ